MKRDARLQDAAWRARHGFDNIKTVDELVAEMPAEQRYAVMDRLDKAGHYEKVPA